MPSGFRRPHHRLVGEILEDLDGAFLRDSGCFFGGGTCITLQLDEYRESRDIDFLCSSREGFRALRETVSATSLGRLARKRVSLAREIRSDRDGIRTFVAAGEARIKLELILEARIDLSGSMDRTLGVPVLDLDCLVAEKFLANTDRGLDDATHARDLIDLAFLAAHHGRKRLTAGLAKAEEAYGAAVLRGLTSALGQMTVRRGHLAYCARALGIEDLRTLKKGLAALRSLASASR